MRVEYILLTNNGVVYDVGEITNTKSQAMLDKLEVEGVIS